MIATACARSAWSTCRPCRRRSTCTSRLSLDLFGSEVSTNAANFYNAGLKGRYHETRIDDDHRLTNSTYPVLKMVNGAITLVDEPALTALNMRLRDDYVRDCTNGIERWNKIIEQTGVQFRFTLPHVAFHRYIGEFKDVHATPDGKLIDAATWMKRKDEWLPSAEDGDFIAALMKPQTEPGRFAGWIAPPKRRHRQQARRVRIREDRSRVRRAIVRGLPSPHRAAVGRGKVRRRVV